VRAALRRCVVLLVSNLRLGICRFSEPLAFNSILAYSFYMVQDLGIPERDATFYSGLLISAYAIAEAITAPGWGMISDVYGRKPIALIGLLGVAMSSIMFGLAKSYWVALLARFIGGALNGNVAIMQTMVAEMVKNPAHERE
jgi:MFS family permease